MRAENSVLKHSVTFGWQLRTKLFSMSWQCRPIF